MSSITIGREELNRIINAGIKTAEFRFLQQLLDLWKQKFPNDIEFKYYRAKITHLLNDDQSASQLVEEIFITDPEFLPAYDLFLQLNIKKDIKTVHSTIHVLCGRTDDISSIYPWAVTLRAVRQGLRKKEYEHSERLLRKLLATEQQNLLAAVEHTRLSSVVDKSKALLQLTEIYHQRWPNCIQIDLWRAKAMFESGKEAEAVSLLHSCVNNDPAGLVATRMWGAEHVFASLWPRQMNIDLNIQIPANIAVALSWNKLPAGEVQSHGHVEKRPGKGYATESPENIVVKKNKLSRKESSGTLPVYVILSTRLGLEGKYGSKTSEVVIQKLEELAAVVQKKPNWESAVFLPDDFSYMDKWGLSPISAVDPWKIKLALIDLDKKLKEKSRYIGAVLIVGCHEVVPFHKLPNPTDDSDEDVPSDNPYSTSSSNYLSPEWSVGRLPGEKGNDAGLILEQLRHCIEFHQSLLASNSIFNQVFSFFNGKLDISRIFKELFKKPKNFGYSAAVWRRSSLAAFRIIGSGSDLRISPAYDSDTIDVDNLMKAKCAFFNLHGLSSAPEWYGQRDFSEESKGPDFPVAISTANIKNIHNNIDLIVSEACYGGYIINKAIDDSLALKFVSIGSQGLMASTCISYGSVFTPLIGADLLSSLMWKYTKEGYSFGESFMRAKLSLISVMTQRQGYLDGEDQKTLISFVLYGDPLGYLEPNIYLDKLPMGGIVKNLEIKTISDRDGSLAKAPRISKEAAANLNEMMHSYIPSLGSATMKVREHQIRINKVIHAPSNQNATSQIEIGYTNRTQLMYSQKTRVARNTHEQFASVTLDENGKVIKLAVSR